jgi:transcriptional regulator with XRE-family HTH domain
MRIGETRPMKDGRIFTMTSARVWANKRSADRRRGSRFVPLRVHSGAHPLVRELVDILNRDRLTLTEIAQRAGIDRCVMHRWRCRSNPSVALLQAALNAAGYELRIAPIAEHQAAIDALERIVGVKTVSAAPPALAAPAPSAARGNHKSSTRLSGETPYCAPGAAARDPGLSPGRVEANREVQIRGGGDRAERRPRANRQVDVDRLRDLHAQGLHDGEIGPQLGVSASAITLWRKKLNLAANSRGGRKAAPAAGAEHVNAAATIVRWLKERGTIIAEAEPGKSWKVNGRDVIDREGLLMMANRKRELAKLPPFAWTFG